MHSLTTTIFNRAILCVPFCRRVYRCWAESSGDEDGMHTRDTEHGTETRPKALKCYCAFIIHPLHLIQAQPPCMIDHVHRIRLDFVMDLWVRFKQSNHRDAQSTCLSMS